MRKRTIAVIAGFGILLLFLFGKAKSAPYTLNVTSTAGGYTTPAGTSNYQEQTDINIYAYANAGYRFDHWELNGNFAGTADNITVRLQVGLPVANLKAFFVSA